MIRVGLNLREKQEVLDRYLEEHKIRKVFVLYFKKLRPEFRIDIDHEYIEWDEIILYRFFYRLLEEIDDSCLIVVDELMRTQNRSELTYNCAHHYLNQTEHKIIFEYFPFIEGQDDFMILLDFENKGRYKGHGFTFEHFDGVDIKFKHNPVDFVVTTVPVNELQKAEYEEEKERLFDELGNKHPDTIPRNLHVYVGKWKKQHIQRDKKYLARNARFKLDNIKTYRELPTDERILVDFPVRRLELNDYLKRSGAKRIEFLTTGLSVDEYYENSLKSWLDRVGEFIAEASLHT